MATLILLGKKLTAHTICHMQYETTPAVHIYPPNILVFVVAFSLDYSLTAFQFFGYSLLCHYTPLTDFHDQYPRN